MKDDLIRQALQPLIRLDRQDWTRKLLVVILVGAMIIDGFYIMVRLMLGESFLGPSVLVNFSLLLIQALLLAAVRRGYVQQAALALVLTGWAGMTYQAWLAEGVHDSAVVVYILIILGCALVMSWRVTVAMTVLSILSIWGLAIGEVSGLRVSQIASPINTAWGLSVVFLFITVLVYMVVNAMRSSIAAARHGEERFRRVFDVSPVAICITSLKDGRLLEANDAYWKLMSLDPQDSIGRTTIELGIWHAESDRMEFVRKLMQRRSMYNPAYEFSNQRGEGRITAAFYELLDQGETPTVLSMFYDVTDQVNAQRLLERSEEKYRNFVESSVEGIWFLTFDEPISTDLPPEEQVRLIHHTGYIQDCNDSLARMYGYSQREELIGKRLIDLYGGGVNEVNFQSTLQLVKSGYRGADRETVEVAADGKTVYFLNSAIGVLERKKLMGIWGTQLDISALKETQNALQRSEMRTRALLETIPDMIFEFDRDGVLLQYIPSNTMNPYLPPEEFLGKKISDVMPSEVAEQTMFAIRRALDSGQLHVFEYQLRISGEIKSYEARVMRGDSNTAIAMVRDVSLRKWAEIEREKMIDQLEAKNAELEQFTYTVSHDLKSPLITIRGFLGFIREDIKTGNLERLERDMKRIGDATEKMRTLLNDLLELSRVGRLINKPEYVDMNELVAETVEYLHGRLSQGNIQVRVDEHLPTVYVDRQRILQVLQNLIDNAAKFMGDQAEPVIAIGQRIELKDMPVIFVRDNGMGIDPRYKERIFGLFNKLDAHSEGTGIGLSLVKRIIEFHGGRIWVESQPGEGATFFFTLPTQPKPGH